MVTALRHPRKRSDLRASGLSRSIVVCSLSCSEKLKVSQKRDVPRISVPRLCQKNALRNNGEKVSDTNGLRENGKNFLAQFWHRQNGTIRNDMEQCGTKCRFSKCSVYGKKIPETVWNKRFRAFLLWKSFGGATRIRTGGKGFAVKYLFGKSVEMARKIAYRNVPWHSFGTG